MRIEGQDFESGVVAEHSDESGVDVEKVAFEAGTVNSVDGGLHQGAVADFGAAQGLLVALAIDGGGQLLRDKGENILVALAEMGVPGIALEHDRAQNVMVDFERDAQPVKRGRSVEFYLPTLLQLVRELGSAEQGFAGAQDVFDEAGS